MHGNAACGERNGDAPCPASQLQRAAVASELGDLMGLQPGTLRTASKKSLEWIKQRLKPKPAPPK